MSKHLKRLAVPKTWSIPKKSHKWAIKPSVGGHSLERSIPIAIGKSKIAPSFFIPAGARLTVTFFVGKYL